MEAKVREKDIGSVVGSRQALLESAVLKNTMSTAKDYEVGNFPHEESIASLLPEPAQMRHARCRMRCSVRNWRNTGQIIRYDRKAERSRQ